jgi:hypothetical protein
MAMSYLHLYRFVFAGEQPDAYKGHYRNRARHLNMATDRSVTTGEQDL